MSSATAGGAAAPAVAMGAAAPLVEGVATVPAALLAIVLPVPAVLAIPADAGVEHPMLPAMHGAAAFGTEPLSGCSLQASACRDATIDNATKRSIRRITKTSTEHTLEV